MPALTPDPFAASIRDLLRDRPIGQVAAQAGVDPSVVSRLSHAAELPAWDPPRRLAVALGGRISIQPAASTTPTLDASALIAALRMAAHQWSTRHHRPVCDLGPIAGVAIGTAREWLAMDRPAARVEGVVAPVIAVLGATGHGVVIQPSAAATARKDGG